MTTVYTAILDNYDNLRTPKLIAMNARYVCFTDRPRRVSGWEIQPCPQMCGTAAKNARIPKCLPHLVLDPDTDVSVYMDGAFRIDVNPQVCVDLLGDADIAMYAHHGGHKSIHDERNFYLRVHGFVPPDVEAQYQRYVEQGVPDTSEFWAGGFIIRRHNDRVRAFNEYWFLEYLDGSANDQFSLYRAAVESELKVRTIPGNTIMDDRFPYCLHASSGCGDNPQYEAENNLWRERYAHIRHLCGGAA